MAPHGPYLPEPKYLKKFENVKAPRNKVR